MTDKKITINCKYINGDEPWCEVCQNPCEQYLGCRYYIGGTELNCSLGGKSGKAPGKTTLAKRLREKEKECEKLQKENKQAEVWFKKACKYKSALEEIEKICAEQNLK